MPAANSAPHRRDLTILEGATFVDTIRWMEPTLTWVPITGITQAAPAVITAASHGCPDGWPVWVQSVRGMDEINRKFEDDPYQATVLTASTIELNTVNALEFGAYTSGGTLAFYSPVDLTGYTARMTFRDHPDSEDPLLELTSAGGDIDVDDAANLITITITAAVTAALTWERAVYDLELVAPGGEVYRIMEGAATVSSENTY